MTTITEFLRSHPTTLLYIFLFAAALMLVAIFYVVRVNRITMRALNTVIDECPRMYKKLLGNTSVSWVERRAYLPSDMAISLRLMRELYRSEHIADAVGAPVCKYFRRCVQTFLLAYVASMLIALAVVATGFHLAASQ